MFKEMTRDYVVKHFDQDEMMRLMWEWMKENSINDEITCTVKEVYSKGKITIQREQTEYSKLIMEAMRRIA